MEIDTSYDIGAFQNLAVTHKLLDVADPLVLGSNLQLSGTENKFGLQQGGGSFPRALGFLSPLVVIGRFLACPRRSPAISAVGFAFS